MSTLTREEMEADLAATDRDIQRLQQAYLALESFVTDSGGEDRSTVFKVELFKINALLQEAQALRPRIEAALAGK